MRYLPRHGEIHGFAAVGQFACEDNGDGVRGVAISGANADAPVLRRGFVADVVQRVHLFDGRRICHAGAGDAAVCLAVGGEVPLIFACAAEELVFAAAEVECVEGGRGFLPPDGFGVGGEVHSGHAVAVEGQPRVVSGKLGGGGLAVFQSSFGTFAEVCRNCVTEAAVAVGIQSERCAVRIFEVEAVQVSGKLGFEVGRGLLFGGAQGAFL